MSQTNDSHRKFILLTEYFSSKVLQTWSLHFAFPVLAFLSYAKILSNKTGENKGNMAKIISKLV